MSLIAAFWEDSTPQDRRLFVDEAAGRTAGAVTFTFDVVDVTLDFDDDPSIGDGLTEMQRRPPTFFVGPDGEADPIGDRAL